MKRALSCALDSTLVAIILNIVLSYGLSMFATAEEKSPADVKALSFKGKIMHMMHHHKQTIFMSSLLIAVVVFLSVLIGYQTKIFAKMMK